MKAIRGSEAPPLRHRNPGHEISSMTKILVQRRWISRTAFTLAMISAYGDLATT